MVVLCCHNRTVWSYQVVKRSKEKSVPKAPKSTSTFEMCHITDRFKEGISISGGFISNLIPILIYY